jgi:hypothetical protein
MIVRIATEGQYEVSEEDIAGLNELDNRAVDACETADDASFRRVYAELVDYIRSKGELVGDDELVASDIILPPPDVSLEEARNAFQGEGLIPG